MSDKTLEKQQSKRLNKKEGIEMQLDRVSLLRAYRNMKVIRAFEERLHTEIKTGEIAGFTHLYACLLYTSPSPRDGLLSRMPSSA